MDLSGEVLNHLPSFLRGKTPKDVLSKSSGRLFLTFLRVLDFSFGLILVFGGQPPADMALLLVEV